MGVLLPSGNSARPVRLGLSSGGAGAPGGVTRQRWGCRGHPAGPHLVTDRAVHDGPHPVLPARVQGPGPPNGTGGDAAKCPGNHSFWTESQRQSCLLRGARSPGPRDSGVAGPAEPRTVRRPCAPSSVRPACAPAGPEPRAPELTLAEQRQQQQQEPQPHGTGRRLRHRRARAGDAGLERRSGGAAHAAGAGCGVRGPGAGSRGQDPPVLRSTLNPGAHRCATGLSPPGCAAGAGGVGRGWGRDPAAGRYQATGCVRGSGSGCAGDRACVRQGAGSPAPPHSGSTANRSLFAQPVVPTHPLLLSAKRTQR